MAMTARDYQVYEILDEIEQLHTFEDKVNQLREKFYDHQPLHRLLKMNFCESIISMVPEGRPPFNDEESEEGGRTSLWQYLRVLPVFVRSTQSVNMKPLQIERSFIEMLESLDPAESETVILAKDRSLGTKWSITAEVAKTAFPDLRITTSQDIIEEDQRSVEEKADALMAGAQQKKDQAKQLQEEARAMTKEAKELLKNA